MKLVTPVIYDSLKQSNPNLVINADLHPVKSEKMIFKLKAKPSSSFKKDTSSTQIMTQSSPEQHKMISETSNRLLSEGSDFPPGGLRNTTDEWTLPIIESAFSTVLPPYLFAASDCQPERRVEGDRKGYERLQTQMNKTTHGIFQRISDTLLTDPDLGMVYNPPVGSLAGQVFDPHRLKAKNLYLDLVKQGRSVELGVEVLRQTLDTKARSQENQKLRQIPYVVCS